MNELILALDIATTSGFAYGPPSTPRTALEVYGHGDPDEPDSGSFRAGRKGCAEGEVFSTFRVWITDLIKKTEPALFVFEAPIISGGKVNIATVRRLTGLSVIAEMVAHELGVPEIKEVPLATIKKHATGNGRADKAMMMEAARNMGWTFTDDNEADALWLHSYASTILHQRAAQRGRAA